MTKLSYYNNVGKYYDTHINFFIKYLRLQFMYFLYGLAITIVIYHSLFKSKKFYYTLYTIEKSYVQYSSLCNIKTKMYLMTFTNTIIKKLKIKPEYNIECI